MKYLKVFIITLTICILACCTIYFSMSEYADTQSATCLQCSYLRDVLFFSIFSGVITGILFYILKRIMKTEKSVSLTTTIIYIIVIFLSNYYIFVDRVSSWSSFSISGELMGVVSQSYIYLAISSILLYFFLRKFMQLQFMNYKNAHQL